MDNSSDQRPGEWFFELIGEKTDINALGRWTPLAGCEIVNEDGRSVFGGKPLNELDDVTEARSKASDIVAVLNGLLRTETRISQPIRLPGSGYRVRPDGGRDIHVATQGGRLIALGVLPDWATKCFAAAELDSNVRDALIAYGAEPSWQKLRHVFEIVRQDVRGETEIIRLGWAAEGEIEQFKANVTDRRLSGSDAVYGKLFEHSPKGTKMTLDEGVFFVGRLLNRWMDSK